MSRNKATSNNAQTSSPSGEHDALRRSKKVSVAVSGRNSSELHEIFSKLEDDLQEVDYDEFEELDESIYYYEMDLIDKIKNIIVTDLGGSVEKASILAPQWAKALNSSPETALTLPDRASEIYAEREVRPELGRKENPIEFLQRVWGRYMNAGVLYQDDIKRLGDPDLVKAVRGRCRDTGESPREVLPPPGSDRTAKLAAPLDASVLRAAHKLAERERSAVRRMSR